MKDVVRFTPQESEQLSKYVSDDTFVKTQKKILNHLPLYIKNFLVMKNTAAMIIILMFLRIISDREPHFHALI